MPARAVRISTKPWPREKSASICLLLAGLLFLGACSPFSPEHLRLTPQSLEKRQLQTRIFDTPDESRVIAASAAVLQDLGFLIDESEKPLGLIVGSKERSAIQPLEVAGKVILAILAAAATGSDSSALLSWDERQIMRICLITTPAMEGKGGISVRVTFQRIVFTNDGLVSRSEPLGTPEIYQEFFAKLSKSLFLEAHEL